MHMQISSGKTHYKWLNCTSKQFFDAALLRFKSQNEKRARSVRHLQKSVGITIIF